MILTLNCDSLKRWFLEYQRDLPWRDSPTPYAVWVSEVMLQQTQVAVVIPYFLNWMKQFPDIPSLAKADQQEVIKAWEGLGYYSRARNLHAGAQYVLEQFNGVLPSDPQLLSKIKGLGPYTIGAIRSFAFQQKTAAVDGNVLRVIARYRMLNEDISKQKTVKNVNDWLEKQLPDQEHWLINEGLIELGATVCKRKPDCCLCPLRAGCQSYLHGRQHDFPIKENRVSSTSLYRLVSVIHCNGNYLVKQAAKGEIMQGLYEFPYFETGPRGWSEKKALREIQESMGLKCQLIDCQLPIVKHTFTRYRASLTPFLFDTNHLKEVDRCQWLSANQLKNQAFSSGHRKICDYILSA